jgi:hypothetical protein
MNTDPGTLVALVAALWTLLSLVVAATRTPIDDALLSLARAVIERLSFLQPRNSPGVVSAPGAPAARPLPPLDPAAIAEEAEHHGDPG